MAYTHDYGLNLGVRTSVIDDLERGHRPVKYFNISDPSFNQSDQSLGRFNSGLYDDHQSGRWDASRQPRRQQPPNSAQTFQTLNQMPINIIPLHEADFTRPPPGFYTHTPNRPVLIDTRATAPHQAGSSAASLANIWDYNEYEGKVFR